MLFIYVTIVYDIFDVLLKFGLRFQTDTNPIDFNYEGKKFKNFKTCYLAVKFGE